uniref:Uncharacterized protein n=1 Tax=Meloidogyne enterolobii TaxID=390850 RepID=A0A6V7Y815_MELEN|nr:unnamed protein product [Meloidogyne enterolobii]
MLLEELCVQRGIILNNQRFFQLALSILLLFRHRLPAQPIKKSLDVPTTGGGQTNDVNNNVSTSNQPRLPTTSNAAPKKSKFDISPEEIGLSSTKKQSSFTEMINDEEADIAEERKITVKYNRKGWEEESSVPAYEIGGGGGSGTGGGGIEKPSRLDTPINQNVNNAKNGVVEGEAAVNDNKKKKTRYTSRIVGQDFTDSEESGDDEDEIVSVKRPGREGQQNVISNQKSDGENLTSFVPQPVPQPATISSSTTFVPPRLSGHRAGIHKFMQEKVEQKKMEGATTTTQQQPNPSSLKPKIKRYPVNYSSDEYDEDDNILMNSKSRGRRRKVSRIFLVVDVTNNNSTPMFNSSLPSQQQQQPQQQPTSSTRHLSTFSSSSINQQQQNNNASTFNSPQKNIKIDSEWLLVDKVEWLRNEANKQKMSHESRPDEGSFIFRKGNEVLVLTESDDKIRASKHCDGRIKWDAYFPKTEWKLFSITILGLVYSFMLRDANSIIVMKGNSDNVRLPRVSNKCKNFTPPYPICLTTHCGQDFLCFFTKKFAFSNHFLTPKPIEIDGVRILLLRNSLHVYESNVF